MCGVAAAALEAGPKDIGVLFRSNRLRNPIPSGRPGGGRSGAYGVAAAALELGW